MVDSIFSSEGDLAIDTSSLAIDMSERAQSRLFYQFQNSCVLRQLVVALARMEQELYDAIVEVLRGFQLANALGVNLDVLGRIVGQERIVLNAADKIWFGFDGPSSNIGGYDNSPNWVTGASLFGNVIASDSEYRQLILGKVFKNHVKVGSVPELIQFSFFLTGRFVSFRSDGDAEIALVVPFEMSQNDVTTLTTVFNDLTADQRYLIPMPVTGRISQVITLPPVATAVQFVGFDSVTSVIGVPDEDFIWISGAPFV